MIRKILILSCVTFLSCNNNNVIFTKKINCEDCLVTKEETAIGIAEFVLFENYGEDKIKSERPYIVSIENDSIWDMRGRYLPLINDGIFYIKISAKDGKVISMIHEK